MSFTLYECYKESGVEWLGKVPEGWEVLQLKRLIAIQNGADHKHIVQEEGFPVIGSGGIFAYASEFIYDGESVLLGRKGTIDKPLYVSGKFWTVDTMYWSKIKSGVYGKFVYYLALTIPFNYYSTNTALPSMTKGALDSHAIACPPLPEQHTIAVFLDRETGKIDELVAEQERLIALLKEKRQATISQAVTKGLNPDAPMKDSGIEWLGAVPVGWESGPLKRFAQVIDCKHYTVTFLDDGCPIVSIRELRDDKIDLSNAKMTSIEEWNFLREGRVPAIGDMIFCRNASVGALGYVESDETFCMGQDVCLIRPYFTSKFMHYLLTSRFVREQIEALMVGATIRRANVEEIRNLVTAIPPPEEQTTITTFLDSETVKIDILVGEARQAIGLLKERRSALISAAVTGKIDVRKFDDKA
jgi:type I restriction enzyme, S subunit